MLQLQIFFNGEQVELFKDESIILTQSIQDIKDIQKVFIPFTQTFNVPASKINNKIFKHFYNFNIVGFDARKKTPAELYLNYKLFKKGKIKLEGVQLKNNEPHTYKLTFFGNTVNLKDLIGEDKLSALDHLKNYKFDYNDTNISTYMANGLDVVSSIGTITDAIIIPLITHTDRLVFDSNSAVVNTDTIKNINPSAGTNTNYGVPYKQLKPAIRIYAIIKAIEIQYGITFSEDFFNSNNTAFYGLYMWLHNKEGEIFQDQDAQHQAINFVVSKNEDNVFTGFKNSSFTSSIDEIKKTKIFDNIPIDAIERKINIKVVPSGSAAYSLVIKRDGEEFQRFNGLTQTTELGQNATLKTKDWLEIGDGIYTFFIETDTVSSYTFTVSSYVKSTRFLGRTKNLEFTATAAKTTDNPVSAEQFIPEIKTIDFLTGLFKMFNLTAFEDEDGIIQVKTLDDFYASSTTVYDITQYLDKTETVTDAVLPYKEIDFKFKGTESFLANNHKETFNTEWGALYYNSPEKYDGQVYNITVPFEHFKYEHLYVSNNSVVSATDSAVQYGYSVDESQNPYLGKPLLFYAVNSTATIRALNLTESAGASIANPYIPLNCENTGSTYLVGKQSINFNAEFDEFSRQVNSKTLFKTYYKTYIEDIFDVRKRLTSAKAFLPMNIIYKLNLADKFILNNNEYRINKISTNFETEQSSLELTNIFEAPVFRNLKVIENNALSADTILQTADNIDITVDVGSDSQFTIPSNQKGKGPKQAQNNPVSDFVDESLQVTSATIEVDQVTTPTNNIVYFSYKITELGNVGDTKKLDEYGFLYSTSITNISSTDDIDTLKAFGDVTVVPFTPTLAIVKELADNGTPIRSSYKKTGLSYPATLYYRFYARTNTGVQNDKSDVISSLVIASTVASATSQFNNANGERITGYFSLGNNSNDYGTVNFNVTGSKRFSPPDLIGVANLREIAIGPFGSGPVSNLIKTVEWFTSVYNPVKGTWYDLSHTWEYEDRFGNTGIFAMTNISGAQIKWDNGEDQVARAYIKGGTVGGSNLTGTGNWSKKTAGDLISTS